MLFVSVCLLVIVVFGELQQQALEPSIVSHDLSSEVSKVVVSNVGSTIWTIDSEGDLLRSTDGGARDWQSMRSLLPSGFSPVKGISVSPLDAQLLYAFNEKGETALSRNNGDAWLVGSFGVVRVVWHLSQPTTWLEVRRSPGCAAAAAVNAVSKGGSSQSLNGAQFDCFSELWTTRDGGRSFSTVATYVNQVDFGMVWGSSPPNRIFCTKWSGVTGDDQFLDPKELVLVYTDDYFATPPVQVASSVSRFWINSRYLIAVQSRFDRLRLLTGTNAQTLQLLETTIPLPDSFDPQHYTLLSWDSDSLVVAVQDANQDYGSVFVSDSQALNFVAVLDRVASPARDVYEFTVMNDVGLYLANVVASRAVGAVPAAGSQARRQTLVSANKGGEWRPLLQRSGGRPLRLHWIPQLGAGDRASGAYYGPQEVAGAPGLYVANGVLDDGSGSTESVAATHTFVTRDFGFSWDSLQTREGRSGPHIVESTLKGAALLLIKMQGARTLHLSLDQGLTFTDLALPSSIAEAAVPPASLDRPSVLSSWSGGRQASFAVWDGSWFFFVDIGSLNIGPCFAGGQVSDPASDFEAFETHDPYDDGRCLMGRKTTWIRRKADRVCYDAADSPRHTSVPCPCTEHDFECNYGFAPTDSSGRQCGLAFLDPPATCAPGETYQAFPRRKVPGNSCSGGLTAAQAADPFTLTCPSEHACTCSGSAHGFCESPTLCRCDPGWFGDQCDVPSGFCVEQQQPDQTMADSDSADGGDNDSDVACMHGQCVTPCKHGTCITADYCRCDDDWLGVACNLTRADVDPNFSTGVSPGITALIVIIVLLILICFTVGLVYFFKNKQSRIIRA